MASARSVPASRLPVTNPVKFLEAHFWPTSELSTIRPEPRLCFLERRLDHDLAGHLSETDFESEARATSRNAFHRKDTLSYNSASK
jgi:hypothetical protein